MEKYIQQLNEEIKKLDDQEVKPPVDIRIEQVDKLIEEFIEKTGSRPPNKSLYYMANYILVSDLMDQYKHHKNHSYPIQTSKQVKRRKKNETKFMEDY